MLKKYTKRFGEYIHASLKGHPGKFNLKKKELIDIAFQKFAAKSFADLGGLWNIHGAYTFYCIDNYPIENAYMVDNFSTPQFESKRKNYKNLNFVRGSFGDKRPLEQIEHVDFILMFDVLLHQVKPDWTSILDAYKDKTNYFVIFNPQWTAGTETVRLLDMGIDDYFENVPHRKKDKKYVSLLENINAVHPGYKKKWRDIQDVWQWGITNETLITYMDSCGFKLIFEKDYGSYDELKNFRNYGFIFEKKST